MSGVACQRHLSATVVPRKGGLPVRDSVGVYGRSVRDPSVSATEWLGEVFVFQLDVCQADGTTTLVHFGFPP